MTLDQQRRYHRIATIALAAAILLTVALLAIAAPLFSSTLNAYSLLGFPAGFYLAAQGTITVFVALIYWFSGRQEWIDRKFGASEGG